MEILVAGGARYIGSYMVNALRQADCKVVVLEPLSLESIKLIIKRAVSD